jgi:argininosuccinate lyase
LVRKGVAFRDAHEAVARAVKSAAMRNIPLSDLPLKELQTYSPAIADDVFDVLSIDGSVAARDHVGGTAPRQVEAQVGRWRERLAQRDSV